MEAEQEDSYDFFAGLKFVLLGFDPISLQKVRSKIVEGGGVADVRYSSDCTHVVVDKVVYDDPICAAARRDGKSVVTNLWVDHSFDLGMPADTASIMYRPLRDLNGIPGAKSLVICLTGYLRHYREDIMTMVGLMGANFSKPLVANKVTHLVCYKFEGEKYELAKKINRIKLVNHLWLEDCLKSWKIMPEADYEKSGYELEMMEAQAKDSEDELSNTAISQQAQREFAALSASLLIEEKEAKCDEVPFQKGTLSRNEASTAENGSAENICGGFRLQSMNKSSSPFVGSAFSSVSYSNKKSSQLGASDNTKSPKVGASDNTRSSQFGASDHMKSPQFGGSDRRKSAQFGVSNHNKSPQFGASDNTKSPQFSSSDRTKMPQFGASDHTKSAQFSPSDQMKSPQFGASDHLKSPQFGASDHLKSPQLGAPEHLKSPQLSASDHIALSYSRKTPRKATLPFESVSNHMVNECFARSSSRMDEKGTVSPNLKSSLAENLLPPGDEQNDQTVNASENRNMDMDCISEGTLCKDKTEQAAPEPLTNRKLQTTSHSPVVSSTNADGNAHLSPQKDSPLKMETFPMSSERRNRTNLDHKMEVADDTNRPETMSNETTEPHKSPINFVKDAMPQINCSGETLPLASRRRENTSLDHMTKVADVITDKPESVFNESTEPRDGEIPTPGTSKIEAANSNTRVGLDHPEGEGVFNESTKPCDGEAPTPGTSKTGAANSNTRVGIDHPEGEASTLSKPPRKKQAARRTLGSRQKQVAKKTLGSRPSFGRGGAGNQKVANTSEKVSLEKSPVSASEGKGTEDLDRVIVSGNTGMISPSSDTNMDKDIKMASFFEFSSDERNVAGIVDDETEAPENQEDNELVAVVNKNKYEGVDVSHSDDIRSGSKVGVENEQDDDVLAREDDLLISDEENSKMEAEIASLEQMGNDESTVMDWTEEDRKIRGKKRTLTGAKKDNSTVVTTLGSSTKGDRRKGMSTAKAKTKMVMSPLVADGGESKNSNKSDRPTAKSKAKKAKVAPPLADGSRLNDSNGTDTENRPVSKPRAKKAKVSSPLANEHESKNSSQMYEENRPTAKLRTKKANVSSPVADEDESKNSSEMDKENRPAAKPRIKKAKVSSPRADEDESKNPTEIDKENRPDHSGSLNVKPRKKQTGSLTQISNQKSQEKEVALPGEESVLRDPQTRTNPAWFILTGHVLQRKEFKKVITRLRGRVCRDSHQWNYQATHLIVPDPLRRTEKFFAAAASGRWILKTDYLTACDEAGRFLPEEPYEWHKKGLNEDGAINLEAPRKWRLLKERTGHGAFYGMHIIIYGECFVPSLDTLKRVVKAGDGTILATSPPYTRSLESGRIDFAIVSPGIQRDDIWVQEFLRYEIPCVVADYLVEYVCKPGYPLDKHVQYNTHAWAMKSFKKQVNRVEDTVEVSTPEQNGADDIKCHLCGSGDNGEELLICGDETGSSGCGIGVHMGCCDPPLEEIPEGDWYCENCSNKTGKKPKKSIPKSKRK